MYKNGKWILLLTLILLCLTACINVYPPPPKAHYITKRCYYSRLGWTSCRVAQWQTWPQIYWRYAPWRSRYWEPWYWYPPTWCNTYRKQILNTQCTSKFCRHHCFK